jgi:hypothetical protein
LPAFPDVPTDPPPPAVPPPSGPAFVPALPAEFDPPAPELPPRFASDLSMNAVSLPRSMLQASGDVAAKKPSR